MCMKKNNNRLLRGVAAVLCLALMFLTMSGMAMATGEPDAADSAPEITDAVIDDTEGAEESPVPEETPVSPPCWGLRTPRDRIRRPKWQKHPKRNMSWTQIFRQAGITRR